MLKSINKKISSKNGASILVALMLLMVCTVMGTIVLRAGTAASGRLSELAGSDQRYYIVNSAAKLFNDELKDNTVTIVRTRTVTLESVTTFKSDGTINSSSDFEENASTLSYAAKFGTEPAAADVTKDAAQSSLLMNAATDFVFAGVTPYASAAGYDADSIREIPVYDELSFTRNFVFSPLAYYSDDTDDKIIQNPDDYLVRVDATLKQDGNLEVTFRNVDIDNQGKIIEADNTFSLQLVFTPDVQERTTHQEMDLDPAISADGLTYTEKIKQTDSKITSITWRLKETKKLMAE